MGTPVDLSCPICHSLCRVFVLLREGGALTGFTPLAVGHIRGLEGEHRRRSKGEEESPKKRSSKKRSERKRSRRSRRSAPSRRSSRGRERKSRPVHSERPVSPLRPHSPPYPPRPRSPPGPPPGFRAERGTGWRGVIPYSDHPRWSEGQNKGLTKRAKQEYHNRRYHR